jgi:hypothetical protein
MKLSTAARSIIVVAVAVAGVQTSVAVAQQVTGIRIAETANAQTSSEILPDGIEEFYVIYEYEGAANSTFEVEIFAPGRLVIFSDRSQLSGDGTRAVEVTGADVLGTIATQLLLLTDTMIGSLEQAQTQQTQVHLDNARSLLSQMGAAAELLSRLPASAVGIDVEILQSDLDDLDELSLEASDLPADQDSTRKEIVANMLPLAESVADLATELQEAASSATSVPLPRTDAPQEGTGYSVILRVNKSPSMSEEIWISSEEPGQATPRTTAEATRMAGATRTAGLAMPTSRAATMAAAAGTATAARSTGQSGVQATAQVRVPGGATATPVLSTDSGESGASGNDDGSGQLRGQPTADEFGGGPFDPSFSGPGPTWTAPSFADGTVVAGDGQQSGAGPLDTGSGPNVVILGLGFGVLAAMALFLRRRLM